MNELDTDETIRLYQYPPQNNVTHNNLQNNQSNIPSNIAPMPNLLDCPICLSSITIDQSRQTTCGHSFHKNCIERWMLYNTTCPVCRHVLVDGVEAIAINDQPEYPNVNDQFIDYLPYRFICGRLRCCYYQIPPAFVLSLQLIAIFFLLFLLINSALNWDGTAFDYISVISTSLILLFILSLHILLRNNWRIRNCRIVPIYAEEEIV